MICSTSPNRFYVSNMTPCLWCLTNFKCTPLNPHRERYDECVPLLFNFGFEYPHKNACQHSAIFTINITFFIFSTQIPIFSPKAKSPKSLCSSERSLNPESSQVFLFTVDILLPACITQFQVTFMDGAEGCVE